MRGNVLNEALEVINGNRQDTYGNPEDSHALIAALWSAYVGVKITAREAAEMLVLFKVARMKGQKPHLDNYRDAAGYIGIAADMLFNEIPTAQEDGAAGESQFPGVDALAESAAELARSQNDFDKLNAQFMREQAR